LNLTFVAYIKTTFVASVLLSILSICILQNQVNAQDFLKKLIKVLPIKDGKELKDEGDYPSAITAFTKSIKKEPNNFEAYYQLGLLFEEVMHKYDKAVSMYKKVVDLSEGVAPTGNEEELKEYNTIISNARESIDRAIQKRYESIEKPRVSVYIDAKPNKKVFKEPKKHSYGIYQITNTASEFRLLGFNNDWYQVNVLSKGLGWISGKDVLRIIHKEAIETSLSGKAAQYERFVDLYPDSAFAIDAKKNAHNIYYELAKEQNTISGYSMYLEKCPHGEYAEEFRLKKDELTFQDKRFINNLERLKFWLENNPESMFLERAKTRIEELMFARAKHERTVELLERYLARYPQGKFVADAKQIIEDVKYEQSEHTDTIDSYTKYLDEYPNGKYVKDAKQGIDERKFSNLLQSKDIELLAKNLKIERNKKRVELLNNRIEELSFILETKANTVEVYRKFLEIYPNRKFYQVAKNKIGELVFKSVKKIGTVTEYRKFIKQYPECKYVEDAILRIDQMNYEYYQKENTLKAYKKFIKKYPENRYVSDARQEISRRTPVNKSQKRKSGVSIGLIVLGVFGCTFLAALVVRLKGDVREKPYHGLETDLTEEPIAKLNRNVKVVYAKSCPSCDNVTVSNKRSCIWCGKNISNL